MRPPIRTRVQLHPATDHWMRGDRYATVVGYTRPGNLRLELDRSGRTICVHPYNVIALEPGKRDAELRAAIERGLRAVDGCCLDNEPEVMRVLDAIMAELLLLGIRETVRPPK